MLFCVLKLIIAAFIEFSLFSLNLCASVIIFSIYEVISLLFSFFSVVFNVAPAVFLLFFLLEKFVVGFLFVEFFSLKSF